MFDDRRSAQLCVCLYIHLYMPSFLMIMLKSLCDTMSIELHYFNVEFLMMYETWVLLTDASTIQL